MSLWNPRRAMFSFRRHLQEEVAAYRAELQDDPIFILGTQKSGTSAIAALLGMRAGVTSAIDLPREIRRPTSHLVHNGRVPFKRFLHRNAVDFSRVIIKEPNLTFLVDHLLEQWPDARLAFVIRDPVQTVRSVLDRLQLPGDQLELSPKQRMSIPPAWRIVVDNHWLGIHDASYIDQLAGRWRVAADIAAELGDRVEIVRYEEFLEDKSGVIDRLALKLGLDCRVDISARLDEEFQPRGRHREDPNTFFKDNFERILHMTAEHRTQFGYGT